MEKPTSADRPATTRPRMTMHVPMNVPLQVTPMAAYLQMPWIGPDDPSLHAKHMKRRRNDAIGLPYMAPFDGESNKKRAKPIKRPTEMIKLEPKRPGNETTGAADYVAWVKFLLQPPAMWYRDQKGRQTTFAIQVGLTQGVPDAYVPLESKGYFTVKLLYENGTEVRDQRILDLKEGAFPEANATSTTMKLRINDISSRHQNQKFRVQVSYVSPVPMRVCPALSNATQVLSKQVKRSAPPPRRPVHADDVEMGSEEVSRASNDSEATVAFSSASPSPAASPLKTAHVERAETPMDVVHHFRAAKPTAVVQWAATAHGILSQVQWARVAAGVYECPVCKVRHDGPRHLAEHSTDCLLRMLMQYPAIFPSPPLPKERSPDLVRPRPLRADAVVVAEPMELNCLSVSAFHASESHLLKSLSRVSVSDHEPDFGSLSSSQLEHFCPPPLADSTHMLSQFTDAPLTSFVEESILAIGLKAVGKRHAAFDRTWSLVGFYHVMGADTLQFEAVSDRDEDAIWDAHPELEAAIRRVRHRRSARDPKVFPCIGDPDIQTLDDIKSRLLQKYTKETV